MRIHTQTAVIALLLAASLTCAAAEKLNVVASTLDMADIAKQIGGDRVSVDAISTGKYDLHFFDPRPSQVMKLREADVLIVGGLDVDIWIQGLIDASRNNKVRFGAEGYVDPSDGVQPIQTPKGRIDGAMGDVHPYGNPHYWVTRENAHIVVENITKGLNRVSPEDAEYFGRNKEAYLKKLDQVYDGLHRKLELFKGTKIIQYHQSWDYFCSEFGLEIVGSLEPKPGIPPSASHLKQVVEAARREGAKLMLIEPYYPERPVQFVARETGAKVLRLPFYVGGRKGVVTFLDNLTYNVTEIVGALSR
ncbi:MAG: metal ABC transporter substrate-binding protein [bacterium]|nr:metal ABC transporter substrate-binding protein [bacterium]